MKLYCSTDMEGVAGVSGWEQVDARTPHPEYAIYRRYYTLEVAAAIEGARRAGAREVLVNDSHGPMRNLLFDDLPSDIRVIFGNRKPYSMVQGADASFGGARAFYLTLSGCTLVAIIVGLAGVPPITLLFYSGIAGGIATPLTMALMLLVGRNRKVMHHARISGCLALAGWGVTAVVGGATAIYLVQTVRGAGT